VSVEPIAPFVEPVRKSVTVGCAQAEAFDLFTRQIGRWWPLRAGFSISGERASTCVIEGRQGGAVYEVRDDGERFPWGTVESWEPPRRVVLRWHPGRAPDTAQEVEVTFSADGTATRVDLVHRNWQRLGSEAGATRARYENGWERVLGQAFAAAVAP
jgi:uncharacterized protein YndB with AHSA1/START domain